LRGRMNKELFDKEVGPQKDSGDEDLVLVCGPEALEKSVRAIFTGMGWKDTNLVFF
jgi:nitrate reductase (NAD(P)H)